MLQLDSKHTRVVLDECSNCCLEAMIWYQNLGFEREVRAWAGVIGLEPGCDGGTLIAMAIDTCDGIAHKFHADGTFELIRYVHARRR